MIAFHSEYVFSHMTFFGPFFATLVLTMASLAVIIVLRSDKAEADPRGMLSQLASLNGWLFAAAMPVFGFLFVYDLAKTAVEESYGLALFGILGGALLGFWILGRAALFPKKDNKS